MTYRDSCARQVCRMQTCGNGSFYEIEGGEKSLKLLRSFRLLIISIRQIMPAKYIYPPAAPLELRSKVSSINTMHSSTATGKAVSSRSLQTLNAAVRHKKMNKNSIRYNITVQHRVYYACTVFTNSARMLPHTDLTVLVLSKG